MVNYLFYSLQDMHLVLRLSMVLSCLSIVVSIQQEANGDGFTVLSKKQGDSVKAGDPIVEVDLKKLRAKYNMSTMLVVTNANTQSIEFIEPTSVKLGQSIIK